MSHPTNAWTLAENLALDAKLEWAIDTMMRQAHSTDLRDSVARRAKNVKLVIGTGKGARRLGSWCAGRNEIMIHQCLFDSTQGELEETVLHEFAHALNYFSWLAEDDRSRPLGKPHGEDWKVWARAVGCKPKACAGRVEAAAAHREKSLKPVLRCNGCGHVVRRLKRFPRNKSFTHGGTCGGKFIHV